MNITSNTDFYQYILFFKEVLKDFIEKFSAWQPEHSGILTQGGKRPRKKCL